MRANVTPNPSKPPQFSFAKAERRVTCYYFYVWDEFWGPGFIKVCAYFPYPVKACQRVNDELDLGIVVAGLSSLGHEPHDACLCCPGRSHPSLTSGSGGHDLPNLCR
jgi:hypothetical protein